MIDASVALGWCFSDEPRKLPDAVARFLENGSGIVPQHFWLELGNAVVMAQRRNRISAEDAALLPVLFAGLQLETDDNVDFNHIQEISQLALRSNLTVYDAAYLDLAIRRSVPIAKLDKALSEAATSNGVQLFQE